MWNGLDRLLVPCSEKGQIDFLNILIVQAHGVLFDISHMKDERRARREVLRHDRTMLALFTLVPALFTCRYPTSSVCLVTLVIWLAIWRTDENACISSSYLA